MQKTQKEHIPGHSYPRGDVGCENDVAGGPIKQTTRTREDTLAQAKPQEPNYSEEHFGFGGD